MKKFMVLILIIGGLLAGTCLLYGDDYEKPEEYNLSIINDTGVEFSYIGLGNEKFSTVLADAKKDFLDKYDRHYFHLDDLNKNSVWNIKAIGKDNTVYEGVVELSENSELIIKRIKDSKLKTSNDIHKDNKKVSFDILSIVKDWYCKVDNNHILSKYDGPFRHSTTVMGKGGKINKSKCVSKNKVVEVREELGSEGYSWINVYH